jgi:hypothetical protein
LDDIKQTAATIKLARHGYKKGDNGIIGTLSGEEEDEVSEEETTQDGDPEISYYRCEEVHEAITTVMAFQTAKVGPGFCVNVVNNKSGCSCLSNLSAIMETPEGEVEYYTACEEIVLWFNMMENMEHSKNNGVIDQSTINAKLGRCVFIKPRYGGRSHGTMVNMSTTCGLPNERSMPLKVTNWKGHDWDSTDKELEFPFHSFMCVQSLLLVWRAVVSRKYGENNKGPKVKEWHDRDYRSIMVNVGAKEIEQKK